MYVTIVSLVPDESQIIIGVYDSSIDDDTLKSIAGIEALKRWPEFWQHIPISIQRGYYIETDGEKAYQYSMSSLTEDQISLL